MSFIDNFKPNWMVDSIYNITPEELEQHKFTGIIADLDNTLIAWDNPEGTENTIKWIRELKNNNIPIVILSNNSYRRIAPVAKALQVKFVHRALKPFSYKFEKALDLLNMDKENVVMVGDQVLTDVLGANLIDLDTILVRPIVTTDAAVTKLNRKIEKTILDRLMKNDSNMKWRHSLNEPVNPRD